MAKDIEWRFVAALLRANRNEQDRFFTQQIPLGVFKHRTKEVRWLYKYREKHGRYPSPVILCATFGEPLTAHSDPLEACLQPVLDMSMYESMKGVSEKTKELLDEGKVSEAMELFKAGAARLSNFSADYVDVNFSTNTSSISRYRETVRMMQLAQNTLVDTPWPTGNKLVHFYRPGNTIVFAARTSIGKTWVLTSWAEHLAAKGIKTLFVTKEMPTDEISDRFECLRYGIDFDAFISGNLPPKEWRRWQDARKVPNNLPLFITGDETIEGTGLEHVVAKIQQYSPQVVVIDGAYLLRLSGLSKNANRTESLQFLSNRCKSIAKALKVVIIVVVQLNRNAEQKGGNSKGGLKDVYGSDSWAQDADGLWLLHGQRGTNRRTLEVAKGRNSNIGEFEIEFAVNPPRFKEVKGSAKTVSVASGGTKIRFKGIV